MIIKTKSGGIEIKEKVGVFCDINNTFLIKKDNVLQGVFCDIDETFLIEGKINEKVLQMLLDYEKQEKKIYLWTGGGSIYILKKIFKNILDIEWPILIKNYFIGHEVEIVLDNMSEEEFTTRYGIKCKQYIKV